ncbi:MAG: transposase, partial [Eubacteriaceae bacterium]|nr:transposase [Eubacteriaceae bacterium]
YLEMRYPAAAASLREGMEETLAVARLEIPGLPRAAVCSTNLIEPANSSCAGVIRRVSNFNNGETALRQAAAGFIEAERGFRRIKGYKQIPSLIIALERETDKKIKSTSIA